MVISLRKWHLSKTLPFFHSSHACRYLSQDPKVLLHQGWSCCTHSAQVALPGAGSPVALLCAELQAEEGANLSYGQMPQRGEGPPSWPGAVSNFAHSSTWPWATGLVLERCWGSGWPAQRPQLIWRKKNKTKQKQLVYSGRALHLKRNSFHI